jgi:hypothetical protein
MWEKIKSFASDVLTAIGYKLEEFAAWLIGMIFDLIALIFESFPIPQFLNYQLADFVSPDISYFLAVTGIHDCIAIIGSSVLFRITRKLLTLGRW